MNLSIIIPAYNAAHYLERCVNSCLNQNTTSFAYEIIIINDGSTDNTQTLAEELAKKSSNIIVISQKNSGVSTARNKGLSIAKGEYIWFVDADDWIKPNCLSFIIQKTIETNIDLLQLDYQIVDEKGIINSKSNTPIKNHSIIFNGLEFTKQIDYFLFAWRFIYKRSFIKQFNLQYNTTLKIAEDTEFNCKVLAKANSCIHYYNKVYYYYQHKSSTINSIKVSQINDIKATIHELQSIPSNHKDFTSFIQIITSALIINAFKRIYLLKDTTEKNNFLIFLKKENLKRITTSKRHKLFQFTYNYVSSKTAYNFLGTVYKFREILTQCFSSK